MTTVVICGSRQDPDRIHAARVAEEAAGRLVLADPTQGPTLGDAAAYRLWRAHIQNADEVLVVPRPDGTLGTSTRGELSYALLLGRTVRIYLGTVHGGPAAYHASGCHTPQAADTPVYTTEAILALLRPHRADGTPAPELSQDERARIWHAAVTDTEAPDPQTRVRPMKAAATYHWLVCESWGDDDQLANADWDRRREQARTSGPLWPDPEQQRRADALARGDDLAAHYPQVSADGREEVTR